LRRRQRRRGKAALDPYAEPLRVRLEFAARQGWSVVQEFTDHAISGATLLKITLKGDLAGMLSAARDSKRSPDTGDLLVQIKLVAGARNRRYRLTSTSPRASMWWPRDDGRQASLLVA
jgi:hypothetical protein